MIWVENFGMKVWSVTPNEKFVELRASTSKKNKDGSWGQSSNWYPHCVGKAAQQAAAFKTGDYVRVKRGYVTNESREVDGKKKSVFSFTVLEFEPPKSAGVPVDGNMTEGAADEMPY